MLHPNCRICGAPTAASVVAREMMFGLRDEFTYDECSDCGCVQLRNPPADWGRYYPEGGYYSLAAAPQRGPLRNAARRFRNAVLYRNPFGLGNLLARVLPHLPSDASRWLGITGCTPASRILDVGSGVGLLVRDLAEVGFSSTLGIDPFVDEPIRYPSGATVLPNTIHEVNGTWDLVMFHHSLEHVQDQRATLERAAELLADGGWCVVRVPVASSYAWRHYRENWVQLDAPRHHVLHTVDSLTRVAAAAGLQLQRVEHDSTELQFWGSEAYRRDVPLRSGAPLFTRAEMRVFRRRAKALNAAGEGDQACFYFQRLPTGAAHSRKPGTRMR